MSRIPDQPAIEPPTAAPVLLPPPVRRRIFIYLGILILLLSLGDPTGALIGIPITFFLKNKLHLTARQVADFRLLAGIPLYLSFVFGLARDTWNPFGLRDRGFLLLFGTVSAGLYVVFAFAPLGPSALLLALIVLASSFLFVVSAQNGLASTLGQQHVMSGQVSAVWNTVATVPGIAALVAGGYLSNLLEHHSDERALRILFLTGAAIMLGIALFGLWRPREVFNHVQPEQRDAARPLHQLKRLLRHRAAYPALLISLLWNFAPGATTPLQYFLQNTLHASDAQWGVWNAIFAASFIPTFLLFGVLCRRYALKYLLFWGTVVAVPQMVPLAFMHSVTGALIAAVPIGLMGGLATAAYLDLLIRSCPAGLQGTLLMLSAGLTSAIQRFGDVLGTTLYDRFGGFSVCVIAITVVYALILPVLWFVPSRLIATADGEAPAFAFDRPDCR